MLKILLIDDDAIEREILLIHLQKAGFEDFDVEQVPKCSSGLEKLLHNSYDMVLLDNSLADSISAEFSVPFIKGWLKGAPLIVISNNIDVPHLKNLDILGVDGIVDKKDLSSFMIKVLPAINGGGMRRAASK